MFHRLLATIMTLTATTPLLAANDDDIAQLIAVDQRQQRAYVDRDWAALEEIFTDDYVLVVSSGAQRTKAQILEAAKKPGTRWEINATRDWQVRVHGDTGIVVATLHQKGVEDGKPFDSEVKFSDTYIRVNGKWRNVHAHASKAVDVKAP